MTREEAIKWIDDRMCFGRGTFTEHHPPNIDECWQAGMMAIDALSDHSGEVTEMVKKDLTSDGDLIYRAEAEIVLCKDCKHHHYSSDNIPYCDRQDYGYGWKDDDYCSRGKRRGGDED